MDYLFFFLTGLAGIVLVIGLIKPRLFTKLFKGNATRGKVTAWFGSITGVFFLLFVVFVLIGSPNPGSDSTNTPDDTILSQNNTIQATNTANNTKVQNQTNNTTTENKTTEAKSKPPSTLDQLWSALDKSMETRENYDIKYDKSTKEVAVMWNATDEITWDENSLVRDSYKLLVRYGIQAFKIEGIDKIRVKVLTEFEDQYGKSKTEDAVIISMTKTEFNKFEWSSLAFDPVYQAIEDASAEYYIHPGILKNLDFEKLYLSL